MDPRVDVEEIETTKSEKLLAVVLALFLLIGGVWTYTKIDDWARDAVGGDVRATAAEQAAIRRLDRAQVNLGRASQEYGEARDRLEIRREAYRTALDARRPAADLERAYRQAQVRFERAERELAAARRVVRATEPAAARARERFEDRRDRRRDRQELIAFGGRFAFVGLGLTSAYWVVTRLRRRASRYLPAALAGVASAAVLATVMAGDYLTDYLDPVDLGPLLLSLFGVVATLVAFAALQRYIARRVPHRRVRRRECPFCGYPVREGEHCEGCGREVIAACTTCGESRRVGTPHCAACGAA
jgi:hypothetical protein